MVLLLARRICCKLGALPRSSRGSEAIRSWSGGGGGDDVVMQQVGRLPELPYSVYTDNYFISIPLAEALVEKRIALTGTVRANHTDKCPLAPVDELKRKHRGVFVTKKDANSGVLLVRWSDSAVVTTLSTLHPVHPVRKARRWSAATSSYVDLDQPSPIHF